MRASRVPGAVIIVGATSAIARALAREFAKKGHDLILVGREQDELAAIASDLQVRYEVETRTAVLDLSSPATHESILLPLISDNNVRLQGAVACAGYLGDQKIAERDFAHAKRILDTNYVGCVSVLNILADHLERQGEGFLCAISSVAGDRGRQSNYLYGSAKAGLSVYLQGLRNKLFRAGVQVVTVKPGFVDTSMTYGRPGLFLVASPESVARAILRAILKGKEVAYVPWYWRWIMLVIRLIPESLFKRLRL